MEYFEPRAPLHFIYAFCDIKVASSFHKFAVIVVLQWSVLSSPNCAPNGLSWPINNGPAK